MPFLVVAGEYRLAGTAPDGDSVRFYPDDPARWASLGGSYAVRRNAAGGAQVRLDGIDALETHYAAGPRLLHQPLGLAHAARDELLRWLGFTRVEREGTTEMVLSSVPAAARGYLLTRSADKYGRPIAFAGRGDDTPAPDGDQAYVGPAQLRRTANHRLLGTGLAYPTYYRALFPDLRASFDTAVRAARGARRGVWGGDRTRTGFRVASLDQVQAEAVILPKLFRRLVAYLALGAGDPSLDGFPAYLTALGDRLHVLPEGRWTGFDDVVEVDGQTVRIRTPVEHLIFDEG